jgi:penicillin-binding protein 2
VEDIWVKENVIRGLESKIKVLTIIVMGIFSLLLLRLWFLQIMQGASILLRSKENQTRIFRINAPRGIFYDRNGKVMVSTRISHNVMVVPDDVKDKPEVIALLSKILNISEADIRNRLKPDLQKNRTPYQYIPIVKDVNPTTVVKLLEAKMDLPGVEVDEVPVRYYEHREFASHIFGYIREINDQELVQLKNDGYRQGDIIGKNGLERTYEKYLRGVDGGIIFEVDIRDRPLRRLENREPLPGNNLHLTIDEKLQESAEKALVDEFAYLQANTKYKKAQSGLALALDPRTGDILAMVSKPGYDPNIFTGPIPPKVAQQLYNNPLHPLTNRVLQGEFAPGSTFKPLVVTAALMEGKVTLDDRFYCNGYDGRRGFPKCWTVTNTVKVPNHGSQSIVDGIMNSCNIVMSELSRRVGINTLVKYARDFRFGKPTGINLAPGESGGFVPDPEWKRRRYKEPWYAPETAYMAIGQGALTVTPLQLAQFYMAIANDGKIYRPRAVSKITNANGETIAEFKPEIVANIKISPEANAIVKEGLEKVIAVGTGMGAFRGFPLDKYPVAGKTGTAQKPPYENNGVFACFAPAKNPEIVIIVLVEQGGSGSGAAAPVARKMLETYFKVDTAPKPAAAKPVAGPAAGAATETVPAGNNLNQVSPDQETNN